MASLEVLANEKSALERRRDQALGALAERAGDIPPRVRDVALSRVPPEQRESMIGMMLLTTYALEQNRDLAAELDELKAEITALKASANKKGVTS